MKNELNMNEVPAFRDSDFDNRVLRYQLVVYADKLLKAGDGMNFKEYRRLLKNCRKSVMKLLRRHARCRYPDLYSKAASRKIHDDIFADLYGAMAVFSYLEYDLVVGIIKERLSKYDYNEVFKTIYVNMYKESVLYEI